MFICVLFLLFKQRIDHHRLTIPDENGIQVDRFDLREIQRQLADVDQDLRQGLAVHGRQATVGVKQRLRADSGNLVQGFRWGQGRQPDGRILERFGKDTA